MPKSCEVHIFDYSLSPEKAEMVQSVSGATLHEYGIGAEEPFGTAMERQLSTNTSYKTCRPSCRAWDIHG